MNPESKTQTVKLSQAIRDGIEAFPVQSVGAYFGLGERTNEASALGCALFVQNGCTDESAIDTLFDVYPELLEIYELSGDLVNMYIISHWTLKNEIERRNDNGTSREDIATWLESLGY